MPGAGRTVIRGGFRSSNVNDEYVTSALNAAGGNAGLNLTGLANGAANINARFTAPPSFLLPPFRTQPISYADANADNGFFFNTIFAIDPNIQVQRNDEFNLGIQREIGHQTAIEIRYVGGRSNNMVRGVDLNQINLGASNFLRDFMSLETIAGCRERLLREPETRCFVVRTPALMREFLAVNHCLLLICCRSALF
jgi:hypothetical protein